MSWKTSPIANRLKQTTGWKFISPNINSQKQLRFTNTISFKSLSFITHWLKYKRWYLLSFQKIVRNGYDIYNIVALRMPRVKLRSNAGIIKRTCCKIKMNSPRRVIDYAIFEKTPQLIRRHYTRRKQLFITAKVLLRKKSLHQQIKKQLVYLNLKKKWLKFLSNYTSTTLDLAMQQAHNNHTNLARQLNKFITIIGKKNIYGTYDFIPQEWDRQSIRIRKKFKLSNKGWLIKKKIIAKRPRTLIKIFVNRNSYKRLKLKKNTEKPLKFLSQTRGIRKNKYLQSYSKVCKLYIISAKKKLKKLVRFKRIYNRTRKIYHRNKGKRYVRLSCKQRKLRNKHKKLKIKIKGKYIYKKKKQVLVKKKIKKYLYLRKQQLPLIICRKFSKKKKIRKNKSLKQKKRQILIRQSYSKKFKKKLTRYKKLNNFFLKKNWFIARACYYKKRRVRVTHLRIRVIKNKVIKHFFKLVRLFKKLLKKLRPDAHRAFMTSYKTKQKGVWRHSIANKIRLKWKKEWNRRALSKSNIKRDKRKRKNYHGRRFNFALTWYLCEAYKRKKTNKVKFRLCSFRLNFLFKNILQNILHMKKTGTIFVRFLQPVRLLISLKKLRKITRNNWVISRYRKQRLYKRLLPYIALLFRYWGFQPLLEQIAFEMEKTKKHWPLLRTIRVLILLLKPKFYTGYRIAVRGKISSSKRTRLFSIRCGKLPISTFQNRMTYSFYQSNARIGSFGIKSWSYFRA